MLERYTPQRVLKRARTRGTRAGARSRATCRTRCTTCSRSSATARSRSASCTRASTSSCASSTSRFNRLVIALVVVGGLIGSSLIGIFSTKGPQIAGVNFLSFVGLRPLRDPRAVAALGRAPLRAVVETLVALPRERTSGGGARPRIASAACRRRCSSPRPSRERGSSSRGTWRATGSRSLRRDAGREALELAERERPDLVLVGGLPDAPALEVLPGAARGRARPVLGPRRPVIVLGEARADAVDRVHAFARGCDDFVPRPFHYEELVARIHAVLRRTQPGERERLAAGPVAVDRATRRVTVHGLSGRALAAKEYELLVKLASAADARLHEGGAAARSLGRFARSGATRTLDSHASACGASLARAGAAGLRAQRLGRRLPADRRPRGGSQHRLGRTVGLAAWRSAVRVTIGLPGEPEAEVLCGLLRGERDQVR